VDTELLGFFPLLNPHILTQTLRYTLGRGIERDPYHPVVIRTSLSRNVGNRFPDVRDEIVCAFSDLLPFKDAGAFIPGRLLLRQLIHSQMSG
jgi:hypothetical protein